VDLQTTKNLILFGSTLVFWLVLISIELATGYSGIFLQGIYGISLFALFVAFWLVNRTSVSVLENEFAQFFASGAIALTLTTLFLITALFLGSGFRKLLHGIF